MYTIFLKDEDMLKSNHFPAIALVNEAFNSDPIAFVKNLSLEIGAGYNYTSCVFWSELDEYDQGQIGKYEGLLIETENGDEITILLKELVHYLDVATVRYIATIGYDCPELITQLNHLKTTKT